MGCTLPVATTERAMSPRSAVAIWVGSILLLPESDLAATMPPPTRTQRMTAKMIQRRLRDLRVGFNSGLLGKDADEESYAGDGWLVPQDFAQAYLRRIPS